MALDIFSGSVTLPTRDQWVAWYLRDARIRDTGADTSNTSKHWIDANILADQMMQVMNYVGQVAGNQDLNKMTLTALQAEATRAGLLVPLLPASGAVGFVTISASTGGGHIFAGDEIREPKSGLRFQCLLDGIYTNGSQVPIQGIDTGPATNLAAGTVMQWSSQRFGIGQSATVFKQSDGSGLTNGRDQETAPELVQRIIFARANPAASGNDAQIQQAIMSTGGIPIGAAFTWPAIKGPGSTCLSFLLRPSITGGSRIPNAAQLAVVLANVVGQMPKDYSISAATIVAQNLSVALKVSWTTGNGWRDSSPWPKWSATSPSPQIDGGGPTPTPTTFRVSTTDANAPVAGQTIAVLDTTPIALGSAPVFRQKKILSYTVAASGPTYSYDIVCDTTNGASDTSYTPVAGQLVSPWSDSLNDLVASLFSYFDGLGPGEQFASMFDAGLRQKRSPASPAAWPCTITHRLEAPLYDLDVIQDVTIVSPTLPVTVNVGNPGALAYLYVLATIGVYPM